ncbi:MAG: DNA-binding transcriptional regulator [Planctomycetota bacterium]
MMITRGHGNPMKASPPHVAVLVDTATGWGRRLIEGVHAYVRSTTRWRVWIDAHGREDALRLPEGWAGDGVIARINSEPMARHLEDAGVPVINVSSIELDGVRNFPRVTLDTAATARLAFEHFAERGFRSFGYCGPSRLAYVSQLVSAFERVVRTKGHTCDVFDPSGGEHDDIAWGAQIMALCRWIETLPKPVAILCWATFRAQEVLEACFRLGVDVPEEVAVLAGDDDDLICDITFPPLSGVVTPSEQIGLKAAELLQKLMMGEPEPERALELLPIGVMTRQSTDTLAIDDEPVAQAVRFIRENSTRPIQVADILKKVPVSRRVLERRFAQVLGRSPAEEIRRIRLAHAARLLIHTDLPIPEVAARSGLGTPQYLGRLFGRYYDMSPRRFRDQARAH